MLFSCDHATLKVFLPAICTLISLPPTASPPPPSTRRSRELSYTIILNEVKNFRPLRTIPVGDGCLPCLKGGGPFGEWWRDSTTSRKRTIPACGMSQAPSPTNILSFRNTARNPQPNGTSLLKGFCKLTNGSLYDIIYSLKVINEEC